MTNAPGDSCTTFVLGTLQPHGQVGSVLDEWVDWALSHPVPQRAPDQTLPRPALTPEEFSDVPLSPMDRARRAELLVRLRAHNHDPYRIYH